MCGIVACLRENDAVDFLLDGLGRLEYRGYDSAGIAVREAAAPQLFVRRAVGRVDALRAGLASDRPGASGLGVGHTRWATHGAVTETNAHPHHDCAGDVAVVHNGIIENAAELRAELEAVGHRFRSDVDSEVIPHLVEAARDRGLDLATAVRAALTRLEGSWAIAVIAGTSDRLVVAANRSPLAVGSGPGGHVVASDVAALLAYADEIRVLEDGDVVELNGFVSWTDATGSPMPARAPLALQWSLADAELDGFADFMEKEITEQPAAVERQLELLVPSVAGGSLLVEAGLPEFDRVRLVGCGTSLHAATVTARVLGLVGGFPTELVVASEHAGLVDEPATLTLAFSQSGETADVLAALRNAAGPVLAVTNTLHSTLARRADAVLPCMAGPEIGVAATKTFTSQVVTGSLFALAAASRAGRLAPADLSALLGMLTGLPERLRRAHEYAGPLAQVVAALVADAEGFVFVSRAGGMPYASEAALKLQELSYRWAVAYPAGELKHGPIALIGKGTPVVAVQGGAAAKLQANLAEMRARGAFLVTAGSEDASLPAPVVADAPWGPLEAIVPLQHLARAVALGLGCDVDKPRNLAKSVTVE